MKSSFKIQIAALLFLINAIQWVIFETWTASAWVNPTYDFAYNYISDLGNPNCGEVFQDREMCSPLHLYMNICFATFGILMAVAVLLANEVLVSTKKQTLKISAILFGIGMLCVATVHGSHESEEKGILFVHIVGAILGIGLGNTMMLMIGTDKYSSLSNLYKKASLILGGVGLIAMIILAFAQPGYPGAIFERISCYTILLWSVLTAIELWRQRADIKAI